MAEDVATCRFAKAVVLNGFLYRLMDHAWIQVVAALYGQGLLPSNGRGAHL